ncbi:hypothetical protein D8I24_6503 [Cupriavidus necator H850]|uniref:hypothetical protein n=1 Tax=Cupriavidus necator TaxID=106590 RepID=UPI00129D44CB|nr:hypothetical protein [Cupriavidus necator]KAI3597687.1 hypothetical protein D8I24_6503 [Cupriavidus necator H850]
MHLEYPDYAVRPRPNRWLVIDDFGTEHNWIYRSGYTEGDRGRSTGPGTPKAIVADLFS